MDVAFCWVGFDDYPKLMIDSVRRHMPHARIVQMTDESSRIFEVDEVLRLPWTRHLMTFRLWHLSGWESTQAVILDADVLVKGDLAHVFDQPFDVALTKRDPIPLEGENYPYNTGVMFSRSRAFWLSSWRWLKKHPKLWDWWGDQAAVREVALQFDVLELPCSKYNWSPDFADQTSDALVWHYKGRTRKEWLRVKTVRGL